MGFRDELAVELSLSIGGETFAVPGGQVIELSLRLAAHGFDASVAFWGALEDAQAPLFAAFQRQDPVRVRLSVKPGIAQAGSPAAPLTVVGLARARSLRVSAYGSAGGAAAFHRLYSIDFADAAQVLWGQHRPIELHTSVKLTALLEPFKGKDLDLAWDWPALEEERPLLCLGLGAQADGATFYDFVLWLLDRWGGYLLYDGVENRYTFAGEKPAAKEAGLLGGDEVARLTTVLPKVVRHSVPVLNSFAIRPTTAVVEQPQAVEGVRHSLLLRTPIAAEAGLRATQEKERLRVEGRHYLLSFKQFPAAALNPVAFVTLGGTGPWARKLAAAAGKARIFEVVLEARAAGPGAQGGEPEAAAGFDVTLTARIEPAEEKAARLPAYRRPHYPISVEGKVRSPGGKAGDKTWFLIEDEKTSTLNYQVLVPLWNETVSVPADPHGFSSGFYFPPYKDERVLLALYFDRAELAGHLEWGEGVRTPQEGEGDQLLLGKNQASQTSLTHDYPDARPELRIRRDSGSDHQLIKLAEGSAFFQVKEDPGGLPAVPTFDVTPRVELAKAELTEGAGGAVGQATAAFQGALATSKAGIETALAETRAAFAAAQSTLTAKAAEVRSGLDGALGGLGASAASLAGAASQAKAALQELLE